MDTMDINVTELKNKIEAEESFILIDVRETYEHEEFNIGGRLVPVGNIPQAIEELADHKDDEIVVYCRSGNRSGMAQKFLQQHGFSKVKNLTGGMLAWQETFQ
jgi:rhodanese-related sulfurtransferase